MKNGPDPTELAWLTQLHLARWRSRRTTVEKLKERSTQPERWKERTEEIDQAIALWSSIAQRGHLWRALSPEQRRAVIESARDEGISTNGWMVA